jgi:hypothetical protein
MVTAVRAVSVGLLFWVLWACGGDPVHHLPDGPVIADAAEADAAPDAVAPPHFDIYADPVNGLDTNSGTLAQPVLTLRHAGAIATSGQTIGLLDGTFREGAMPNGCDGRGVIVPGGLTFRSVHPRAAVMANISFGVNSGSLSVIDVTFDGGCTGILDSSADVGATLTVTGVKFINGAHLVLSGDVVATVTQGSLGEILSDGMNGGFGVVTQSAELVMQGVTIDGGATTGVCQMPLFQLGGAGKLTLDGATVKNFSGAGIVAAQAAQILLENHTMLDHVSYVPACAPVITLNAAGSGVESTTLTVQDSAIQNSSLTTGIGLRNGLTTVTLTNSALTALAFGIRFNIAEGGPADLQITGSQITQSTQVAIDLRPSASSALHVAVQGSTFTGNVDGLELATGPGSTVTLTANTIQNPGTGITLDGATAITATAHGNTWVAGQQAADVAGHYPDGTLVTSANAAGANYKIVNGSTLDL